MSVTSTVFETAASTIPPPRRMENGGYLAPVILSNLSGTSDGLAQSPLMACQTQLHIPYILRFHVEVAGQLFHFKRTKGRTC